MAYQNIKVIYIHGIGIHPGRLTVKQQYDETLFGATLGDQTRLAYYADLLHPVEQAAEQLDIPSEYFNSSLKSSNQIDADDDLELVDSDKIDEALISYQKLAKKFSKFEHDNQNTEAINFNAGQSFSTQILPNWPIRRRITRFITRQFLKDVHSYLFNSTLRSLIQQRLRTELVTTPGPCILVAHSLGSIVAYDVLHQLGNRITVPLWITLGSPLGNLNEPGTRWLLPDHANSTLLPPSSSLPDVFSRPICGSLIGRSSAVDPGTGSCCQAA